MKLSFSLMFVFLFIDQASKIWVRANVEYYHITPLIPNFLELTFVENKGVSFSLLADLPTEFRVPFLIAIPAIAVVAMLFYLIRYWTESSFSTRAALTFIIPGAMGNLIDRIIFHAVTDFFHFRWYETSFFVNNIADCFISVGVVFFIYATFMEKTDEKTEASTIPTSNKETTADSTQPE